MINVWGVIRRRDRYHKRWLKLQHSAAALVQPWCLSLSSFIIHHTLEAWDAFNHHIKETCHFYFGINRLIRIPLVLWIFLIPSVFLCLHRARSSLSRRAISIWLSIISRCCMMGSWPAASALPITLKPQMLNCVWNPLPERTPLSSSTHHTPSCCRCVFLIACVCYPLSGLEIFLCYRIILTYAPALLNSWIGLVRKSTFWLIYLLIYFAFLASKELIPVARQTTALPKYGLSCNNSHRCST